MKQVYFHIGMPKTGSTALQRFFAENKTILEKSGVGYHMAEKRYEGHLFRNASFLLKRIHYELWGATGGQSVEALYELSESFAEYARDYDKLILTEKIFWVDGCRNIRIWQSAKSIIEECVGADCIIRPIVYLRRPDVWIPSFWKQRMRGNRNDERTPEEMREFVEGI